MFKDFNFKLAVISELHNQGFYLEEAEAIFEKNHNEEDYSYKPIPAVLKYYKNLNIDQAKLDLIEELRPDGGDQVYMFLMNNWDGEDNQFDIKDLSGIEHLKNLKIMDPIAMISEDIKSVSPLLQCKSLEFVDLDLFQGAEDCQKVAAELSERGVEVNITDQEARSELYEKVIALVQEANVLFGKKEYEKTIQVYLKIAELTPDDPEIYGNIAAVYEEMEDEVKVIEYLKLYHTHSEGDADTWFRQAALCDDHGFKEDALNGYLEALKHDDTYGDVYNALGYYYIENGDPLKAVSYLEKAIENNEEDFAEMNLGHVHLIQGDESRAIQHYRKSFKKYLTKADFKKDYEDDFQLLSKYKITRDKFDEIRERILT
jgi:tetratricopeptide (TPR) repeat protein